MSLRCAERASFNQVVNPADRTTASVRGYPASW